jgi:hypothetical protein
MVAWPKVTRPVELGELGVLDLATLRHALRLRWAWLARVDPIRTWTALPVASDKIERAMFEASTSVVVGCGSMEGQSIISLTPDLVTAVDRRAFLRPHRGPSSAGRLLGSIHHRLALSARPPAIPCVMERIQAINLEETAPDRFVWKWSSTNQYSASSAYRAFFIGQTGILGAKELHKVRVPPVSKIFVWLALLVRCWKSERCSALCVLAN